MKKIFTFVVLLIIAVVVGGYIAAGPFITIYQIKSGLENQNSEQLSEYIDFPMLRSNLKEQFNAFIIKKAVTELKDNPSAATTMGFAAKLADGMVDSFVTPSNLASLMEGKKLKQPQPQVGNVKPQESTEGKPEPFKNTRYTYDNSSKVSVWVKHENGDEIRFILTRNGLSWKLSNIIISM